MRGTPFRVEKHPNQVHLGDDDSTPLAKYVKEITKLIPYEVVVAYLAGKSLILAHSPNNTPSASNEGLWIGWTAFGLVLLLCIRTFGSSDKTENVPIEWSGVVIAALSYVLWVYSYGDVFQALGWWSPVTAGLALIAWTPFAPYLLRILKKILPG